MADATSIKSKDVESNVSIDVDLAPKVLRKIDWRFLPIMFITYNFNFIDKTILSSASVFGLKTDTHLVGQQYSWVSSVFYFGYLVWAYPTTYLIQRLPVGKYVSINTIIWGTLVALTASCKNFGGLITVRFLLGVAEATITPAFVYVTSMWYTRDEIPIKTGAWFAGNSFGGLVASLAAYGVGRIKDPLSPWQWLFITFGVATGLWGIIILLILPDSIESCGFLNEEEKKCAQDRVILAGTGKSSKETSQWKREQVFECFLDPKTWFFFAISICTQIPNSGTQNFGNLVLEGFGFTNLQTTLVGLPSSIIAFLTILTSGWIAGRVRNISTFLIIPIVICPVVGSALIYSDVSNGIKLFGYYLLSTGPGALPLSMSLMSANYKGVTKKMTMTALLFIAYCTGNIAGPQFFKSSESPHYPTAFRTIMICYALVVVEALGLRFYLSWVNRMRDISEKDEDVNDGELDEDVTDLKTVGMRYRL
ncbi:MFS general substrate transporter [Guyanagaster necrorhizus]|uniref:MFS general substrate transporter n=1 Tax=Guyanagaster necrorhizus TaxID=856835 RepID=A0A9P7VWG6_9AGAR|nr:MFS general substrate transporter [Guyanagaster necrorhizus MCA 3950]KAG7447434.1 MFS general substrate transporter [Guyanagaster necrorhizus MCA 3950]